VTPTPAAIAELLDHPDRLIELFAVHNFRDVGGYPTTDGRRTAWRKVFRADGLYRLTPEDIEALRPIGLRTVIDLRTTEELSERGTFPVDY
jgi:protein-tyrosine phosphatase